MSDTPASRKTRAREDLQRRILMQALEPGAPLDEVQLAAEYGLSRPPLREVLSQLAGEGYVEQQKNRGAQVAPLTHKTLHAFFVAAPMIYAAVSKLAAENASAQQIQQLKEAQIIFRTAIREGDAAARALANERFHALIGEMAGNDYLLPSLRRLLIDHTRISMTFYSPRNAALAEAREVAADQHDAFIALIEAGDGDGAALLAVEHWELSRAEMTRFVVPQSMEMPLGRAPAAGGETG